MRVNLIKMKKFRAKMIRFKIYERIIMFVVKKAENGQNNSI
jgi:hypothetical protein